MIKNILTNPNIYGVIIRQLCLIIGSYLAFSPETITALHENITTAFGAIMMVVSIIIGIKREPTKAGAIVAEKFDQGAVKVVPKVPVK